MIRRTLAVGRPSTLEGVSRFDAPTPGIPSRAMTTYLVECYWAGVDEPEVADAIERLANTLREQDDEGGWVSSILIPDDEMVLCLATGWSAAAGRATSRLAGLPAERVVPCEVIRPRHEHGSSSKGT